MIKSIKVTNHIGEEVKIDLMDDEPKHGMLVKSIEGLGPPKANINSSKNANFDGEVFNSTYLNKRNIVISLLFTPAPSIEDTRQRMYKYFSIKKSIVITIEMDNRTLSAFGVVESNDPNIFSDKEGSVISILCVDPYLYSNSNIAVFSGTISEFKFPFANNSKTAKTLKVGSIERKTENVIYYNGDSKVGIVINIDITGSVGDVTIYNTKTREFMKLYNSKISNIAGETLKAGDKIIISTLRGDKKISLIRSGKTYNILNAMDKDSSWFSLENGDNIFAYDATGFEFIYFSINYQTIYEGV